MCEEQHLIVIGGTAAGMSAASNARRACPSLKISVFEKTGFISYGSCGLPYYVGGMIEDETELVTFSPEQVRTQKDIAVLTHHEIVAVDAEAKTVTALELETGESRVYGYSKLVIATGASPIILPIPGVDLRGVFTVRTVEDGVNIRDALRSTDGRVVVIGAGWIGLEMAAEMADSGAQVTVLEAAPELLPALHRPYAERLQQLMLNNGVRVLTGTSAAAIEGETHVKAVYTDKGERIPASMVIMAVGVKPNSRLAGEAGLELGIRGGIVVDAQQRTSDPNIWACGDCVQMFHLIDGSPAYIPLGTTANKQGKIAGLNAAGAHKEFPGVLGSQATKLFDLFICATGFSKEQALKAGYAAESHAITKRDRASYYPGGQDNELCLIFDTQDGKLLGAQGIGSQSIAGRINALAVAITAGMTLEDVSKLDLVYAPPVAPVYDPILIAASQSLKKVSRRD